MARWARRLPTHLLANAGGVLFILSVDRDELEQLDASENSGL